LGIERIDGFLWEAIFLIDSQKDAYLLEEVIILDYRAGIGGQGIVATGTGLRGQRRDAHRAPYAIAAGASSHPVVSSRSARSQFAS
jgi:hypothetical protein